MWRYSRPDTGIQLVLAEMQTYHSVEREWLFGRCLQLLLVSTLDVAGPARRLHQLADEFNASFNIEVATGAKQGRTWHSAYDMKFVRRLGREFNSSQICWEFERFSQRDSGFVVARKAALWC